MTFTSCIPTPLISLSLCIPLLLQPSQNKASKQTNKYNSNDNKISLWKLWCVLVCPTVYSSVHASSLAKVHCNEPLVWFEASVFSDTIKIGFSPRLLLVILLLSCVMEILQLWVYRTGPFTSPNHLQMIQFWNEPIQSPVSGAGW